jgi:alkylhydroperoxidase family enzyme
MPRIAPLSPDGLVGRDADCLKEATDRLGFLPHAALTLARVPDLYPAIVELGRITLRSGQIDRSLKYLVAYMASTSAGCRFCAAHTSQMANKIGVGESKFEDVWNYESSSAFTEAERAALRVARGAGMTPNAVTDDEMADLVAHFGDDGAAEVLSVIAYFGFMNRWNDTALTPLEDPPLEFGLEHLIDKGWQPV